MSNTVALCFFSLGLACTPVLPQDSDDQDSTQLTLLTKLKQAASNCKNPLAARTAAVDAIGRLQTKSERARVRRVLILQELLDNMAPARLNTDDEAVVFLTHVVHVLGALGGDARDTIPSIVLISGYEAGLTRAVRTSVEAILNPIAVAPPKVNLTELLSDLANSNDASKRLAAAKALAELADPSILAPLAAAASSDPNDKVKAAAAAALAKVTVSLQLNRKVYVASLIAMLDKETDLALRIVAAKKLGELGTDALPAIDALMAASKEDDPDLKLVTLNAIKRIQPK